MSHVERMGVIDVLLHYDLWPKEDGEETRQRQSGLDSWWSPGGLSVCFVEWDDVRIEDPFEFSRVLGRCMPDDVRVYGCKGDRADGRSNYFAVLGFPFRLASWAGLGPKLELKNEDGEEVCCSSVHVAICRRPDRVDHFVKFFEEFCRLVCYSSVFGERLTVGECVAVSRSLRTAGEMWKCETVEGQR